MRRILSFLCVAVWLGDAVVLATIFWHLFDAADCRRSALCNAVELSAPTSFLGVFMYVVLIVSPYLSFRLWAQLRYAAMHRG